MVVKYETHSGAVNNLTVYLLRVKKAAFVGSVFAL